MLTCVTVVGAVVDGFVFDFVCPTFCLFPPDELPDDVAPLVEDFPVLVVWLDPVLVPVVVDVSLPAVVLVDDFVDWAVAEEAGFVLLLLAVEDLVDAGTVFLVGGLVF